MKKFPEQPAKKSYFFEQGFIDIKNAIQLSWQKNAQEMFHYYQKYATVGLLSFRGGYYLLCALAIVSFGTVFFSVISLMMLSVVLLFFGIVYVVFSIVWSVDRVYLVRKKIFAACYECKTKSLIPTYVCPKCHARHSNLTPGDYGIIHRTCNCGEQLPTTFFNGRKNLQAVCPHCLIENKVTMLTDRESRPFCIPIVGGRSTGKTAYITAFSNLFIEKIAPANQIEVELYNQSAKDMYQEIRKDFHQGSTRMTSRTQNIHQASAISFSFFVKNESLSPERLIHLYDIAGEVFTDNTENEVQRQYDYCQGMIFMLDPLAIPSVRARYDADLREEDRSGIGNADINGVINVFMNKLREVTGLNEKNMSSVPIAIIIGKIDTAPLLQEFSKQKVQDIKNRYSKSISHSDAVDLLCREFLAENGMENFVNTIAVNFKNYRYFALSAIGHTRDDGRPYQPSGVLEPMEWICTQVDKPLAKLWVKNEYSKRPLR